MRSIKSNNVRRHPSEGKKGLELYLLVGRESAAIEDNELGAGPADGRLIESLGDRIPRLLFRN